MTLSDCCDARAIRRFVGRRARWWCTDCHRPCEAAPEGTVRVDRRVLERALALLHDEWSGVWDKPTTSASFGEVVEVREALEKAVERSADEARR